MFSTAQQRLPLVVLCWMFRLLKDFKINSSVYIVSTIISAGQEKENKI